MKKYFRKIVISTITCCGLPLITNCSHSGNLFSYNDSFKNQPPHSQIEQLSVKETTLPQNSEVKLMQMPDFEQENGNRAQNIPDSLPSSLPIGAKDNNQIQASFTPTSLPSMEAKPIIATATSSKITSTAIEQNLGPSDKKTYYNVIQASLENNKNGAAQTWSNNITGNTGSIIPIRTFQKSDGTYCRNYKQIISIKNNNFEENQTACRSKDGVWIASNN